MSVKARLAGLSLTAAVLLAACGDGREASVPRSAEGCGAAPEFAATSLPNHLQPRPGPAILYAPPPRAPQLENTGIWQAAPILISGASAYRCGEFLYQDWLFDDRGAAGLPDPNNPHGPRNHLFSPTAGTLTYPTDPVYANNAADLVELRIRPLADATAFRITLNTLQDPDRVAITLALGDSDAARDWPHGAGVSSPAELFATVHGAEVELVAGDGAPLTGNARVSVDLERRQIELRLPHAVWNPGEAVQRIAAGVGLWDPDAGEYLQPGLTASSDAPGGASLLGAALVNMAFRSAEPMPEFQTLVGRTIADAAVSARVQARFWRDRLQADQLALGDVSPFFAEVDFAKLARGESDESGVPQSGHMNRVFASRYTFGQGLDYDRACGGISAARPCDGVMVGQLQPYAVYVPEKPEPPGGYGLTLLLHALSANYNQYLGTRHAEQFGKRGAGSIVVTPGGRGPDGFYFDVAEADTFEVWADIARHYRLDPDWVAMSGVSMGGIGSFRLAVRYPDLFARIMPIVAGARLAEQLPSLRHVPVMMWNAALDELQPITTTEGTVTDLDDLGLRYDVLLFPTWDHLTPSTYDYYAPAAEFLGEARVERNPPQITYVLVPAEDEPRVKVIADRAYWLSGLELREPGQGRIEAHSEAFGTGEPGPLAAELSFDVLTGGNHDPAPYNRRIRDWAPPQSIPATDRLVIRAENIARVTVHPERAGLSCSAELDIDSDGPIDVRLAGC